MLEPGDEHNQQLRLNTHPPDWRNPVPRNPYNLVVIGAGTAGLVAAAGAAGLGARVALVEKDQLGGDCLHVGCVPSKAILRSAAARADIGRAGDFGVEAGQAASVNFGRVMERMRRLRARISRNDSAERFTQLGVDVFLGEGRFRGPRSVDVSGLTLVFAKAVIATGARAAGLPIPGLAEAGYLTNETVFNLVQRPARLIVIGAGPIGCEMSQAFQRLGSRVATLETAAQVLIKEDEAAARVIEHALRQDGVDLRLGVTVTGVARRGAEKLVRFRADQGGEEELAVDEILVSAGRAPNVERLGLEQAGVQYDPRQGVWVDDRLRTSNPRIYAAGDICSRFQFTHAADFLARTVIANALFSGRQKSSALHIPWTTYTDPQVAHVGLTEKMAGQQGVELDTFTQPLDEVDRAILDGETDGFVKVHVVKGSDRIAGATIVARHAGDMIGELVLAMVHRVGLGNLAKVIHPYPTQAEAIRKTGDLYNRTRLTPMVKKILGAWLRGQRGR